MIPNRVHFIFGLREDFNGMPFSFVHYLAVLSALETQRPERMDFHCRFEPGGFWWEKAKPLLSMNLCEPPEEIFGRPLRHGAHQADVLRLQILRRFGGIYLDMDVICLKSLGRFLGEECVMGVQDGAGGVPGQKGLCNAVILAQAGAPFIERWLQEYRSFRSAGRDAFWDEHSVRIPARLAREMPGSVRVENERSFFWPGYLEPGRLWDDEPRDLPEIDTLHLWETLWWEPYLKALSPEVLKNQKSCFGALVRPFVDQIISGMKNGAGPVGLPAKPG